MGATARKPFISLQCSMITATNLSGNKKKNRGYGVTYYGKGGGVKSVRTGEVKGPT